MGDSARRLPLASVACTSMAEPPDTAEPTGPADPDRLANRVKLRLLMAGVEPDRVADLDEVAALELARTRLLWGDQPTITIAELAERSGLGVETCRRARMLLGMPDPGDAAVCRVEEVDNFRGFAAAMDQFGEETILQYTRVIGDALATVAEGALSVFGRTMTQRDDLDEIVGDAYVLEAFDAMEYFRIVPEALAVISKLHFEMAIHRLTADPGSPQPGAVGFVDLVDSTKRTVELGEQRMADAVTRFEEWSVEQSVRHGGRVVKYIGDEVMFRSPDIASAAAIATRLVELVDDDPDLGSARAGVAAGQLLGRDGDWYGITVNLAARLVERARDGAVWLAGDGVADVPGAVPMRGRRRLRGLPERVEVWRIDPGQDGD